MRAAWLGDGQHPEERCSKVGPPWGQFDQSVCTLPKGHDGDHQHEADRTGAKVSWADPQPHDEQEHPRRSED